MNKAVKWILAIAGLTIAMIVIAVLVLPMVIDVQKYKPQIEQQVAKATGLSSKVICELFPCGIAKGAYRLAGLPRPAGCL